jgi:hypothetical protein
MYSLTYHKFLRGALLGRHSNRPQRPCCSIGQAVWSRFNSVIWYCRRMRYVRSTLKSAIAVA